MKQSPDIILIERKHINGGLHESDDVVVRDKHSLGIASRTRRKNHIGKIRG